MAVHDRLLFAAPSKPLADYPETRIGLRSPFDTLVAFYQPLAGWRRRRRVNLRANGDGILSLFVFPFMVRYRTMNGMTVRQGDFGMVFEQARTVNEIVLTGNFRD